MGKRGEQGYCKKHHEICIANPEKYGMVNVTKKINEAVDALLEYAPAMLSEKAKREFGPKWGLKVIAEYGTPEDILNIGKQIAIKTKAKK
jgi:hypothetical protein